MRLLTLLCLMIFCTAEASSQLTLTGSVIDEETKQTLSYVNIGVIGENIGTVSGRTGGFELDIPDAFYSSMMRISIIGYEPVEMQAHEVEKLLRKRSNIGLKPASYSLDEIVVSDTKAERKVVGNKKWRDNVSAALFDEKLGKEMGLLIKIKKRRTLIKDVSFVLGKNENDTVRFRLNVYTIKRGKPHQHVLKENVIIEAYKGDEVVTTDLEKYNIVVEDDFFIGLEWIEDYPEDSIYFAAALFGRPALSRPTSQAKWVKVPFLGIGLYATILY